MTDPGPANQPPAVVLGAVARLLVDDEPQADTLVAFPVEASGTTTWHISMLTTKGLYAP